MSLWETLVSCPALLVSLSVSEALGVLCYLEASSQATLPTSTQLCSAHLGFGLWEKVHECGPHLLPSFSADCLPSDPVQPQYGAWLSLVDRAQVKAFVDLTLSPSVRQGAQHLLRISGLGELLLLGSPLPPLWSFSVSAIHTSPYHPRE